MDWFLYDIGLRHERVNYKPQSKLSDMRDSSEGTGLAHFRKYNQNKLVIVYINMNTLGNKFELNTENTKRNVDILLIPQTKIDENFPDSQFKIDCFSNSHGVDRNEKGGGIMLSFREDLPVKVLSVGEGNEGCYVEMIDT